MDRRPKGNNGRLSAAEASGARHRQAAHCYGSGMRRAAPGVVPLASDVERAVDGPLLSEGAA
ncbi:hypothetical protein [Paenibacillus sp. 32O-W]|uniref:hypothetical protein n=1 Tax=Paenibacillus sp. 32O-W TaxID=1695218 RepID=UPI001C92BDC2|nr:hypothetical protein [Paenibacillus sp. 32O-W]